MVVEEKSEIEVYHDIVEYCPTNTGLIYVFGRAQEVIFEKEIQTKIANFKVKAALSVFGHGTYLIGKTCLVHIEFHLIQNHITDLGVNIPEVCDECFEKVLIMACDSAPLLQKHLHHIRIAEPVFVIVSLDHFGGFSLLGPLSGAPLPVVGDHTLDKLLI